MSEKQCGCCDHDDDTIDGYDDEPFETRTCGECGGVEYWVECPQCDGEGYVNRYEEDPLWYEDKDIPCTSCGAEGGFWWCQGACSKEQEATHAR